MTKVAGVKLPSAPNMGAALMIFSYFATTIASAELPPPHHQSPSNIQNPADFLPLSFPTRSARKNPSQHDSVDFCGIHEIRFLQDAKTRYVSIWTFA